MFVVKVLVVRLYAAAACLVSMLLMAWAGAFIRAVSARNWHVFKTLDGPALLAVAAQAARYQGYLLPVLLSWAVLLLLTPAGYTLAFRAAVVAAGLLGYVRLSPPPFLVTARVTGLSHWLARSGGRPPIPYLLFAIATAYVLLSGAAAVFGRLDYLHRRVRHASYYRSRSGAFAGTVCATLVILLVLLATTWAATVVRLAGAGRPGAGASYGRQGALYQDKYLLVLVLAAVVVALAASSRAWLIVAVILTGGNGLAPGVLSLPSAPQISAGRDQLIRIGTAWGGDTLWAALFVFIPAVVAGMYLAVRLLRYR